MDAEAWTFGRLFPGWSTPLTTLSMERVISNSEGRLGLHPGAFITHDKGYYHSYCGEGL